MPATRAMRDAQKERKMMSVRTQERRQDITQQGQQYNTTRKHTRQQDITQQSQQDINTTDQEKRLIKDMKFWTYM